MLKNKFSLIASIIVFSSVFTGCSSKVTEFAPESDTVQQENQVSASSISGISKEITKTMKDQFKAMDKDANKEITPAEYGVTTAENIQAFKDLDSNKDGKIAEKEFMPNILEKAKMTIQYRSAARKLFTQLDKSKDGYLSKEELNSPLISAEYLAQFEKYDKEKALFFFINRGTKTKLSKSEFENMFADIAIKALVPTSPSAPAAPAN